MPNRYGGIERRKSVRVAVNFIIVYQVDQPVVVRMMIGWNKEIEAKMLDLSEGGMAVLTDYDIPAHTLLSIRFILINLALDVSERVKNIRMSGLVRYSVPEPAGEHRLGIYFTKIADEDKKAIAKFVWVSSGKKENT